MVFCNNTSSTGDDTGYTVTILILIDGFLQCDKNEQPIGAYMGHNPYFNRWFSAIKVAYTYTHNKDLSQSLF